MYLRLRDQHRPMLLWVNSVIDRDSSAYLELGDYNRPALPVDDVIHVHVGILSTHDDALWGPWAGRGAEGCTDAPSCGWHAGTGRDFQLASLQCNGTTLRGTATVCRAPAPSSGRDRGWWAPAALEGCIRDCQHAGWCRNTW